MTWTRHRRIVGIALAVVAVQVAAVFAYRAIEKGRSRGPEIPFVYERLNPRLGPDLALIGQDGTTRRLTELRGKPVLLHFWATWCPPCKKELPGLLELTEDLSREHHLTLVAVAMDKTWDPIRAFLEGALPSQVVRSRPDAASAYEVATLPDTFLLDARGTMRLRFGGARDWSTDQAAAELRSELRHLATEGTARD